MKKLLEVLFLGIGALGLFALALVGFGQIVGAPMNDLPVVGSFFPEPEVDPEGEGPVDEEDFATDVNGVPVGHPGGPLEPGELPPPLPEYADAELQLEDVITSTRAAIANYVVSSPFSREELVNLQKELNQSLKRSRARLDELDQRELDLEEYAQLLEEKATEIDQLRQGLDRAEKELQNLRRSLDGRERSLDAREDLMDKREESIRSQEESLTAEERAQLDAKASLFLNMDPEMAVARLEALPISEARRIFQRLPADVAEELLNVMPDELWTQFLDAFTEAP